MRAAFLVGIERRDAPPRYGVSLMPEWHARVSFKIALDQFNRLFYDTFPAKRPPPKEIMLC